MPAKQTPLFAGVLCLVLLVAVPAGAAPRVELEVVTDSGVSLTAPQQWLAALKDLGWDELRLRARRTGDQPDLQTIGEGDSAVYRVVGVVTSRGTLQLPNGSFTMNDRAGMRQWIEKLRGGGERGLTVRPAAFGLLPEQLVTLHQQLAVPLSFSTKGQPAKDVVRKLAAPLAVRISVDAALQGAFGADAVVAEELQGMSSGSALAVVLRPLGLVHTPQKGSGGEIYLAVVDSRAAAESWPIGWPPQEKERELVPKLFEFLNVEIQDVALSDALDAIGKRFQMPFLFDHNALARHRIDPAQVRVSLPAGRTYYKSVLDKLLFQGGLKGEIRTDEAGQPLLWISTLRK